MKTIHDLLAEDLRQIENLRALEECGHRLAVEQGTIGALFAEQMHHSGAVEEVVLPPPPPDFPMFPM